jgi:hypothetical protein
MQEGKVGGCLVPTGHLSQDWNCSTSYVGVDLGNILCDLSNSLAITIRDAANELRQIGGDVYQPAD